jgi:Zn-dependent protease with chaperone function
VTVSVYLPLVLGTVLAVVGPALVRTLPPAAAVWSLTCMAIASAVAWVVSLGIIASTGVERTSFVAHLVNYSATYWRHVDPVAVPSAIAAGVVLLVCLGLFVAASIREAAAALSIRRLTAGFTGSSDTVFVQDETPHAYAVGGRRPRIVVSSGLMRSLGPGERRAVLAHEAAHLRRRHHMHLRVLRLAAAVHPLLRPAVPAGLLAVERWADEDAARSIGDRTVVARSLLQAALVGTGAPRPAGVLAHSASGDVSRRVAALLVAPPRPRWSVAAVSALMVVAAVLSPVYSADHLDSLLSAGANASSVSTAHR